MALGFFVQTIYPKRTMTPSDPNHRGDFNETETANACGRSVPLVDRSQPHLAKRGSECRPAVRSPEDLRLHPAISELQLIDAIGELNEATRLPQEAPAPILISRSGTILAGFGYWQLAILEGKREINCIEYPLTDDESLQFILIHHRPQHGWNAFIRTCLALRLEPYFQQRALDNMRAGGRYKGLADLPKAQRVDVREEIAALAGVAPRTVTNVKTILKTAHPRLIEALKEGTLTINRALQLCKLPKSEQMEHFICWGEQRAIKKVIRASLTESGTKACLDIPTLLTTLQLEEARQPGSVSARVSRLQRTVILVGQDLLDRTEPQKEDSDS